MKRQTVLVLLALALAVAGGCQRIAAPAAQPIDPLASTAPVARGTIAQVVTISGQIAARNARELGFPIARGRVREVLVQQGQTVAAGQPLIRLDTTELERKLREAQADLKVAETALAAAQQTAGEAEVARAQAAVVEAEYAVAEAEYKLTLTKATARTKLEQAVEVARAALQRARDNYRVQEISAQTAQIRRLEYDIAFLQRKLRDLPPGEERDAAAEGLADAERKMNKARADRAQALRDAADAIARQEAELARAEQALARVVAGTDDPTAAAQLAYEQALVQLETAQKALADLQAGVDTAALKAAKTAHEAALAKVEAVEAEIEQATLVAPFAGVVFALYVAPDDRITSSTTVIYLADPSDLRVQAQATELDIIRLQEGQRARVTVDAYPGQTFWGTVLTLPPRGEAMGGMNYYLVQIALDPVPVSSGLVVRPGMMAAARVITGEKKDVLTVPSAALRYEQPNITYVLLANEDGTTTRVDVEIGLNDGIRAEVVSGLVEGQTVVVPLVAPNQGGRGGFLR